MIKILKVGRLKEVLESFSDTTEVTVWLNIVDEKSNNLFGVLFDVDSLDVDGPLLQLIISEQIQDAEICSEEAKKVYLKKKFNVLI